MSAKQKPADFTDDETAKRRDALIKHMAARPPEHHAKPKAESIQKDAKKPGKR